jgi:hypothetical protein
MLTCVSVQTSDLMVTDSETMFGNSLPRLKTRVKEKSLY